ncbi:VOC family protein [Sphingobacterium sp. DK4209]|uniref:Bleomycin resistance protein n=1 Tax=Sphingobacterium zhuxiongii TaxID=2662364 RepID=A0A5Q0QGV8_9SPHI|nr:MULTISPECIES: VOC family protein [unclassified Sphingobacterium]MVZ66130.1 VOC family protein [Sphingobacterium sp. DK4209]QGA26550.1 VOC family protein [Sphingobacterium sp. dk4302]
MLTNIHPKIPSRDIAISKAFYSNQLGFRQLGAVYDGYLMLSKDQIELHLFEFKALNPKENYGMIYIRTNDIDGLYAEYINNKVAIHPNAPLQQKPWGKEFSILDPDSNLITFGGN